MWPLKLAEKVMIKVGSKSPVIEKEMVHKF
jgi:hypothetical protein